MPECVKSATHFSFLLRYKFKWSSLIENIVFISYEKGNLTKTGYITENKIIIGQSKRIRCRDFEPVVIPIENNTRTISSSIGIRKGISRYKIKVMNETKKYEKVQLISRIRPNMQHYYGIWQSNKIEDSVQSIEINSNKYYYTSN